ncbi:MAG: hypothetical protein RL272_1289 [Candidatus Parcubacteria bacterium]|jgi:heme/copper-type cytochrome/quinol oxidase subunit 2
MTKQQLTAGMAALALGSLLIVGAGCANGGTPAADDGGARSPRTGTVTRDREGQPDIQPTPADVVATDTAPAREIKVTATNFAFSPSEIRVKKGERIKLTLTNAGGVHGIGIPTFKVSLKAGEGETVSTVFTADQAGSFPFFCNVFCGEGHRDMLGTLIVE